MSFIWIIFIVPTNGNWRILRDTNEIANFTVDIGKFFTTDSEQDKRFRALEDLIRKQIDELQTDRGVGSVVSVGDIEKIRQWLNPNTLYLYDKNAKIFSIDWQPVDSQALFGELIRLFRRTKTWIAPIRIWKIPGDWKNIIRLQFDLLGHHGRDEWNHFGEAIHELIHHAEFENQLHVTDDFQYTAFRERNATFWDEMHRELGWIRKAEEVLMDDGRESEFFGQFYDLLDALIRMRKWEAGSAVSEIEGIKNEKYQTWQPDHTQLYDLMGIKVRSRDILEHYASGACGDRLQLAARWIAWRLSFDDEERKLRQEALQFTKIHHMSAKEVEEHLKMVESRLSERRKAFQEEFQEFVESSFPKKETDSEGNTVD